MKLNCIVSPFDGFNFFETDAFNSDTDLLAAFYEIMKDNVSKDLISHIKFNDALHLEDLSGPRLVARIKRELVNLNSNAKIFLDFKLADTKGTNLNILKHYLEKEYCPDIVTIRDCCSINSFLELRRLLPKTVKLALVSVLTDMPVKECIERYKMSPQEKIISDIEIISKLYDNAKEDSDIDLPFDMVVCSPLELDALTVRFKNLFEYIVPGIRDEWMAKGQQARFTGVKEALEKKAKVVVMGSQMTKGNPEKGVSAAESRQKTKEQISLYQKERA